MKEISKLRIRPYRDSDAKTILSWSKDAKSFYNWCAGVLGDYPITEEQFSTVKEKMAFTAITDHEIVGFFILRHPGSDMEELRFGFVIVDPRKRGFGCGKEMLRLGLKYAFEIYGAKKVTLGVFKDNEPAYQCYKSVGFREIPDFIENYSIRDETWECLELEIKQS